MFFLMSYYDATIYLQFGVNDMNKKKSGEKAYASKIKKKRIQQNANIQKVNNKDRGNLTAVGSARLCSD